MVSHPTPTSQVVAREGIWGGRGVTESTQRVGGPDSAVLIALLHHDELWVLVLQDHPPGLLVAGVGPGRERLGGGRGVVGEVCGCS